MFNLPSFMSHTDNNLKHVDLEITRHLTPWNDSKFLPPITRAATLPIEEPDSEEFLDHHVQLVLRSNDDVSLATAIYRQCEKMLLGLADRNVSMCGTVTRFTMGPPLFSVNRDTLTISISVRSHFIRGQKYLERLRVEMEDLSD